MSQHLIFDAHLDMAWNALEWNRDLMLSVDELRQFESQFDDIIPGECTVTWPELSKGRIGTVIATLLPRLKRKNKALTFYQSREAAYAASKAQLAYYRAMVERGVLREISDKTTLDSHVAEWEQTIEADSRPPIGFIISMEGSWSVLAPSQIAEWYEAGLRILGPAHYGPDYYCHGTGSVGGLKEQGPALLKEMDRVGMLLDATHLSDQSFWEAMDIFGGPVLASHHNCRSLVDRDRQLSDDQIKVLVERGAVIGAAFDSWMLGPDWTIGITDPKTVSLEDVVNHIDHVCQIAGNARHSGLGTDLDGGFGKEQCPHDLETIADLQKIGEILDKRGYSAEDIEGIMYRNFVDFFRRAWS